MLDKDEKSRGFFMSVLLNNHGQPIGRQLPTWTARPTPPISSITGRFCRIEKLLPHKHAADLFAANQLDKDGRNWTYLGIGPFETIETYHAWLSSVASGQDPFFHAIIDQATNKAIGVASLMRIDPANGVIEVGHINYSPLLQAKPHATEAMFLLMSRVFDELGYRRYEWKCDSLNAPSRAAALRYGFKYEGEFRQAIVYKGRNRDTTWYSIIDSEWPAIKAAYQAWLDPANFDAGGQQRRKLAEFMPKQK
jgi:RimJ/RimL family protein N-acetyltransferase